MAPARPVAHAPPATGKQSRAWLFVLAGLVVIGGAVAIIVFATRGGSKSSINCDKFVAKQVALATAGTDGALRDDLEKKVRNAEGDSCANGRVTQKEYDCVMDHTTRDGVLECLGLAGSKPSGGGADHASPASKSPPASKTDEAVAIYYQLQAAFLTAYGAGDGDCEHRVPRVEAALAAQKPELDKLVALVKDPDVGKAVVEQMEHPTGPDNVKVHDEFKSKCIDGTRSCCDLENRFYRFISSGFPPAPGEASAGTYNVGDKVYARWEGNDEWYPGKIGKVNGDGTYRIDYNDGDVSPRAPAKRIKPR